MGSGTSPLGKGGSGAANLQTAVQGYDIDRAATGELNQAVQQMQATLTGNFLMPEKKKVGKLADKLMNNGDILVIKSSAGDTIATYRKFDKGWWTQVVNPVYSTGSYDIGDIGGRLALNVKQNHGSFTIQREQ